MCLTGIGAELTHDLFLATRAGRAASPATSAFIELVREDLDRLR
jgi:hypothetical protein